MNKKTHLLIIISFALLQTTFSQNPKNFLIDLKPQKISSISYKLNNFLPSKTIKFASNLFIFGNLKPSNSQNYPAVFITKPYPTLKLLSDTGYIFITDATAVDSTTYIVGYAKINDSTKSYLAKIDELGNLQWDTIFNFPYQNQLCCLKIIDSTIYAAGSFQDPNFIQNLQLLKLSLNGQIISGKSIPVSVNFFPKKLLIDDNIIVCANYSDKISNPILFKFDRELNLIKIKKFQFHQKTIANDIINTNFGFIIAGQKNDKPWILALNQNLNTIKQQTFHKLAKNEQFTQIQKLTNNFLLSTITPTPQLIISRTLSLSPEGFIQWDLPESPGIQQILASKNSFKTLTFSDNSLTITSYRLKHPFIWHKNFYLSQNPTPLYIAFLKNKILAITKSSQNSLNLWTITTNGLITLHKTLKNLHPITIHHDKNFIYILSLDHKTNQLTMTFTGYNLDVSSYPLKFKDLHITDFNPTNDGFIFLTTNHHELHLIKTDFKLHKIWQKLLHTNALNPKLTQINDNLLLAYQQADSPNNINIQLLNSYGHIKSTKITTTLTNPHLTSLKTFKNLSLITLTNNDSSQIYIFDPYNHENWSMTFDFKISNAQIINQKLLITHGNKNYLYLTYINTVRRKILKTIQIPEIDGQNVKITSTRFFYILTNSYLAPSKSNIIIKTR